MANDIQPYTSALGSHFEVHSGKPTAASTFTQGVPVKRVAAGTITIGASPVIIANELLGISAEKCTDADSVLRTRVGVYLPGNTIFVSSNFSSGGSGVSVTPLANATALALIGKGMAFVLTSTTWFVDTGGATNIGIVTGFLDANGKDITISGDSATRVLFRITASQLQSNITDAP